jgi:hypothetical protein
MSKLIYKNKVFISAIALSWILPGTAISAEHDSHRQAQDVEQEQWIARQPTFSELDKDQDGYLSKEEAESWDVLSSKFDDVDKNGDQKIDRPEFSAFETQLIKKSIREFTGPK